MKQEIHIAIASEDHLNYVAEIEKALLNASLQKGTAIAVRDKTAKEAIVVVDSESCSGVQLKKLKKLLLDNKGTCPVKIVVKKHAHSETVLVLPSEVKVEPSESLCNKIEQLFGHPVLSFV